MHEQIDHDLNHTRRDGRLAQSRRHLVSGLADLKNPIALADALIALTQRLSMISIEEVLLVATKLDAAAYAKFVQALAAYAEQSGYVSPHDLEIGDALAAVKAL